MVGHPDPHRTHPGRNGVIMPVIAYTNLDDAELFLNGKFLGKKPMTDDLQIVWKVPYTPGELKVVATGKNGETQTMTHRTAGKPATVTFTSENLEASEHRIEMIEPN